MRAFLILGTSAAILLSAGCARGSKLVAAGEMVVRSHRDGSSTVYHLQTLPTGNLVGRPMPTLHVWTVNAKGEITGFDSRRAAPPETVAPQS